MLAFCNTPALEEMEIIPREENNMTDAKGVSKSVGLAMKEIDRLRKGILKLADTCCMCHVHLPPCPSHRIANEIMGYDILKQQVRGEQG